jgi:hypothetical protein
MHPNAALLTLAAYGRCSMQTELLLTSLSAKHLYAAGENGQDNVLFHKLLQIQKHMTQLVAEDTGEHMTKLLRLLP